MTQERTMEEKKLKEQHVQRHQERIAEYADGLEMEQRYCEIIDTILQILSKKQVIVDHCQYILKKALVS
jgi:hypothetical protein